MLNALSGPTRRDRDMDVLQLQHRVGTGIGGMAERESGVGGNRGRLLVAATAGAVAGLYLIYIVHYAVDAPAGDDWSVIATVDSALHGHLTFNALWDQHFESRMLFPNLLFITAGFIDRYNLRSIIILSALIYIASFFLLLVMVRAYIGRALTALPTLILGLVWFSLCACIDALWAFQIAWYMVVLALVCLLYVLLVAKISWGASLALGIAAAVVASYSAVQGLLLWPVGLLVLLWATPWVRRTYVQAGIWVAACVATSAFYLRHFAVAFTVTLCPPKANCTAGYALTHPVQFASYSLRLMGNLFPSTTESTGLPQELLGLLLCIAGAFVIVQSFRERRGMTRLPLPLALVVFAALNDGSLVVGRLGFGSPGDGEYTLPQVVLLAGILIYIWGHLTTRPSDASVGSWRRNARVIGYGTLCCLLAVQLIISMNYGLKEAAKRQRLTSDTGRLVVNLNQIPPAQVGCDESWFFTDFIVPTNVEEGVMRPIIGIARADQLAMFNSGAYKAFRAEGPPSVPECSPNTPHRKGPVVQPRF
jgi:hypothetical protein